MVGIMGKYVVTYWDHPGHPGIVIDGSKRGAARWMSASQAEILGGQGMQCGSKLLTTTHDQPFVSFSPIVHLMELRSHLGFNMVPECSEYRMFWQV